MWRRVSARHAGCSGRRLGLAPSPQGRREDSGSLNTPQHGQRSAIFFGSRGLGADFMKYPADRAGEAGRRGAVAAVTGNSRQAANNLMITGSDRGKARTRRLRDRLSRPSQPATAAPPVNPVASRLRSAGPLGPSTAAGAAAAFLSPARGYRQRQAGRRGRERSGIFAGGDLAHDSAALAYGARTLFSPILCIQK